MKQFIVAQKNFNKDGNILEKRQVLILHDFEKEKANLTIKEENRQMEKGTTKSDV